MVRANKLKICLAASAGGHLSQLLAIADSWKGHDTFCVATSEVVRGRLQNTAKPTSSASATGSTLYRSSEYYHDAS